VWGGGAIGEKVELLFLDTVLHLPAGTVEVLVEGAGIGLLGAEGGDHEAWIRPFGQALRLGDDPPRTTPALAGLVVEFAKDPTELAAFQKPDLGLDAGAEAQIEQPLVAGEPQHVVNPLGLAPGHDRFATKARVTPNADPGLGPAAADLGDDPRQLLHTACRGVDVGGAQPRAQQVLAAKDVQRQILRVSKVQPYFVKISA